LPSASVSVVLTDPPYSSGTRKEGQKGIRKSMTRAHGDADWFDCDSLTTSGFVWLMRECARQWRRILVPGGHAFVFIDWRMLPHMAAAVESADLRHAGVLVWDKTYFGMGSCFRNQHEMILHFTRGVGRAPKRRDVPNVLAFPPVRGGIHPTEKPVALLRRLLSVVASPGDLVCDPFAGSGATAAAAAAEDMPFVGWEVSPAHHEAATARLEGPSAP